MGDRGLVVVMAIIAALVMLSILASALLIKPCARGEGGARVGNMLVAGCGFDR